MRFKALAVVALTSLPVLADASVNTASELFAMLDTDTDGTVSYEEAMAHRNNLYFLYDIDRDGFLDSEEQNAMTEDAISATVFEQDGRAQSFNDVNNDGRVSMGEFLSRSLDWLWLLDRDGDGSVAVADLIAQS